MRLVVQKYGGTSVGTPERICHVAQRILETQRQGCRVVAVVSAMAGVTDELLRLGHAVAPQPTKRELDILLSTGEQAAAALTAMAVNGLGGTAISLTGAQAGILTDRNHTRARIANISPKQIHELLADDYIVIVAGFQGQTPEGETTTLGRGGSDLTAIALAGALNADACQIFTDVDGVFTCDPRIVKDAEKLGEIAYDELLEMAGSGAKVMQSRAVEFAKKFGVEFEVRSTFKEVAGTVTREETPSMEDILIRGISLDLHQAKLSIAGVRDKPGIVARIFSDIGAAHIIVDMIVQNASIDGTTDISFTIHEDELENARTILMPVLGELGAKRLNTASGVAKLSVVGIGMRSHSGVAARLFACLGRAGINIQMVSTSEIKIAVIIDEKEAERAAAIDPCRVWLGTIAARRRRDAAVGVIQLLAHRIDVKFLGAFNPHLVAKDAVNHCGRWMISDFRPIPVVSVCLFPCSSIFQTNDGPAGQPLKGAIHATYKQIHLGVGLCGSFRSSFLFSGLFSDLAVALEPGIEFLQLFRRQLIQACSLEFFRRHHFLDAARRLWLRCTCRCDTGQHCAKSKAYAPE